VNKISILLALILCACGSQTAKVGLETQVPNASSDPQFSNTIKTILEKTILYEIEGRDTIMMYTQNIEIFNFDHDHNLLRVDGIDMLDGSYDTIVGVIKFDYRKLENLYHLVEEGYDIGTFAWINRHKVFFDDVVTSPIFINEFDDYGNNLATLTFPNSGDSIYQYRRILPISYNKQGLIEIGEELSRSFTKEEFSRLNFNCTSPDFSIIPNPESGSIRWLKEFSYTFY